MSSENIILALDLDHTGYNQNVADTIQYVGMIKIGMQLFYGEPSAALLYPEKTFLDLKLNDIPETVRLATRSLCRKYKPKFLSVHLTDANAVKAAVEEAAAFGTKILGITVLTSMTKAQCIQTYCCSPRTRVELLVSSLADYGEGFGGFVCSGEEASMVRKLCPDTTIVTPGVRSVGIEHGDQKRVVTPAEAVKSGANYVVVGRQIRDAKNPLDEAKKIAKEIEERNNAR